MFQFQCWLLDTLTQDKSFRQAELRFAAALLSRTISQIHNENRG
jgi:hypothetical protein